MTASENTSAAAVQPSPQKLSALIGALGTVTADADRNITGLALDSRAVSSGSLFLAVYGHDQHGLKFLQQAIDAGAAAVAWEPCCRFPTAEAAIPAIEVENLGQVVGEIAARWFAAPSSDLYSVGITGTDGKTSTSHLVAQLFELMGQRCATIGTLGYGFLGALKPATHTTPDPVTLQGLLSEFRAAKGDSVVMEVSSHALDQGRIAGVEFNVVVFTNLGHDHLDYHGDLAQYLAAKKRLFDLPGVQKAVINLDDENGYRWAKEYAGQYPVIGFTHAEVEAPNNVQRLACDNLQLNTKGAQFDLHWNGESMPVASPLLGRFNVSNLLAAIGVLLARGHSLAEVVAVIPKLSTISGRYQGFSADQKPLVVVDYAHTPGALQQILLALRDHCSGELHCIFGCGGNRDRAKRPMMGAIAEQFADQVVVTNDNPRDESDAEIARQVMDGVRDRSRVSVELDRAKAIRSVIGRADTDDVVLVAGKGHEEYQLIAGERVPYSDVVEVSRCLGLQPVEVRH